MWSPLKNNKPLLAYAAWSLLVFFITFSDGLNADDITHVFILVFFAITYRLRFLLRKLLPSSTPLAFIGLATIFAAFVEGFYMISKPLHPSLVVTKDMGIGQMMYNYGVDVLFTFPAYVAIFSAIWLFVRRYEYSNFGYALIMGLGQALGDGLGFLLANPGTMLFLPYILFNYHAMNVVPFLLVRNRLQDTPRIDTSWKYLPIVVLPLIYFTAATVIFALGPAFGFFAK
ncbi:hypothetical protein C4571_00170 [Candidatus Parcubacteria bacterium]|nr:MAG: hypothetical protein C4571_00170 [Candidatus Parcubacteria bacterium]